MMLPKHWSNARGALHSLPSQQFLTERHPQRQHFRVLDDTLGYKAMG